MELELPVPVAAPPAAAVGAASQTSGSEDRVPWSLLKFTCIGHLELARCPAMAAHLATIARSGDFCSYVSYVRERVDNGGAPLQCTLDALERTTPRQAT